MSFSLASSRLTLLSTRHTLGHLNRSSLISSQRRLFSSSANQGVYDEMLQAASEIKDYNYRSYFTRRVTEDMQLDSKSAEELSSQLEQIKRIKTV